jgi:hypothetical protein
VYVRIPLVGVATQLGLSAACGLSFAGRHASAKPQAVYRKHA